ncbi:Retrovirus-related Pol polyprotein from transposon 17.6 [Dictyocoela muelleri]|nr:Retrovirus-related Pol polyprotein from transposon 17.6 [Dictyocoela muelleri]
MPDKKEYVASKKSFNMNLVDTNIIKSINIEILENIDKQDVDIWTEQIKELVQNNNYSKTGFLAIIKALVSNEYKKILDGIKDPQKAVEKILSLRYNRNYSERLQNKLRKIRQVNFTYIEDFYNEINKIINELRKCNHWNEKQADILLESKFIEQLTAETRMKMRECEKYGSREIIEYIRIIEEGIHADGESIHNKRNLNSRFENKENILKGRKHCTFHNSNTHETNECKALKNKNSNFNKTNTLIMKERNSNESDLLYIEANINNKKIKCVIDTGSTHSIINSEISKSLNLKEKEISTISLKTASDNNIESTKIAKCQLSFPESSCARFNAEFLIMNNLPVDIIIGNTFLKENKATISLSEHTINLSGFTIQLSMRSGKQSKNKVLFHMNNDDIKKKIIKIMDNEVIGKCISDSHQINLSDQPIIFKKQYPVPFALREKAKSNLKELVEKKIIRKSNSYFSSPAFFIRKKNGELRLVVDYTNLNKVTVKETFPCPNLQECLIDLSNSNIFSSIDLNMGYHQIPMHKDSIKFTSFIILNEQYEYLRMPFGLTNAPRTFQRIIQRLLSEFNFVKVYLDDILIHSKNKEDHSKHVLKVCERLKQEGLTINLEKSDFMKYKIEYLGHYVTPQGYFPRIDKLELYKKNNIPKTKRQLQKLLGILNWFRPFIVNLSLKILFLTDKLKGNSTKIVWINDDSEKLNSIWKEIANAPKLSYPDFGKIFYVESDASERGIGSVVYQDHGILGLFSYKFNSTELNYSIVEKETFAIYKTLERFKTILFHAKVIIRTDNRNTLFNSKNPTSRINRWKYELSQYSFQIEHIKSKMNVIADYLSRIDKNKNENKILSIYEDHDLLKIHRELGHPGNLRTYKTLKLKYNIQIPYHKITNEMKKCLECRQYRR